MTRWQQLYLEDSRIPSVSASNFAKKAVDIFTRDHKRKILDLGWVWVETAFIWQTIP